MFGPVAQGLERYAYNVDVGGSIPPRPTMSDLSLRLLAKSGLPDIGVGYMPLGRLRRH